ncbi:SH3 domain-containing protein [Chryseobacterium capnotolerans]|uniref:SH3 domain-containing protein n=1 Tax=Chryseobacterium TaxID=59732 RepID=UPI00083ADEB0|nr:MULTISPECIES: SH3 domain-containing protein [Chryseobacterium]UHO37073.1 SH3 domain-containing protein [Chryseobacterium capnotolerans]
MMKNLIVFSLVFLSLLISCKNDQPKKIVEKMQTIKIFFFLYSFLFCFTSCDGQKSKNSTCSVDNAIKTINSLPEVQKQSEFVDSLSKSRQHLSFMTDTIKYNNKQYYRIKTGFSGQFHWETYTIFYVDKNNCKSVMVDETISGDIITLEKWRNLNKKNKIITSSRPVDNIEFSALFNEGTVIKFTPQDLVKKSPEIQNFKQKLELYENENPLIEDFDNKNLSYLINNETFFDVQYYIDNSWLQYFITKYKVDVSKLNDLMNISIHQEDFNAVKLLADNGYIISKKDLNILIDTENNIKEKVQENKSDGYESYIISNSKINQISQYLKEKYSLNKIADPDGYTNLRKDKNTSSEVLQKVKSGEHIEVLDNTGDWFLVKTKEGKEGYIHKSRIK